MRSYKCKFNFYPNPKVHIEHVQHPVPNTRPQNNTSRVFPGMSRLNLPTPTPTLALPPSLHALPVPLRRRILIRLRRDLFRILPYFLGQQQVKQHGNERDNRETRLADKFYRVIESRERAVRAVVRKHVREPIRDQRRAETEREARRQDEAVAARHGHARDDGDAADGHG
jgi:hypothetical protein